MVNGKWIGVIVLVWYIIVSTIVYYYYVRQACFLIEVLTLFHKGPRGPKTKNRPQLDFQLCPSSESNNQATYNISLLVVCKHLPCQQDSLAHPRKDHLGMHL